MGLRSWLRGRREVREAVEAFSEAERSVRELREASVRELREALKGAEAESAVQRAISAAGSAPYGGTATRQWANLGASFPNVGNLVYGDDGRILGVATGEQETRTVAVSMQPGPSWDVASADIQSRIDLFSAGAPTSYAEQWKRLLLDFDPTATLRSEDGRFVVGCDTPRGRCEIRSLSGNRDALGAMIDAAIALNNAGEGPYLIITSDLRVDYCGPNHGAPAVQERRPASSVLPAPGRRAIQLSGDLA